MTHRYSVARELAGDGTLYQVVDTHTGQRSSSMALRAAEREAAIGNADVRTSVALEAAEMASAFRRAATELDELAGGAHAYEPGTLRRKLRAVTLATMVHAVEIEGVQS